MAATGAAVSPGVVVALLTVYLVWGSTYLAIKYVVAGLPPFLAMGVRFLLAGTVLLAAVLALRGRDALRMTRAQLGTAAVCGLFLLVGGNGVVAVAEQDVDSGLAALLIAGTPLWVVLLRAVLRDRPSAATVAGLLLGLTGVAVLLLPGVRGAADLGPMLLVCLSSVLWSCGTVLATRRPMPGDPFAATVVEMAAGGLGLVVLGSLGGEWGRLTSTRPAGRPGSRSATWCWSAAWWPTARTCGCSLALRCPWPPRTPTSTRPSPWCSAPCSSRSRSPRTCWWAARSSSPQSPG